MLHVLSEIALNFCTVMSSNNLQLEHTALNHLIIIESKVNLRQANHE